MDVVAQGQVAHAYTGGKAFDPGLPVIAFLHGALHDHSVWTLPARWFAHHGHAVLALDLPGHGRSGGTPLTSVEAMADWLLAVLDAAGVERAVLVGHSMGSLVALQAAARAPQRCERLVMVGTAWPMKVSDALLSLARENPLAAIDRVNAFSISTHAAKPGHPGPGGWLHGANRALMRRQQRGQPGCNLFEIDFLACDRYAGALQAAARVCAPAHLLLGQADQMTAPAAATELAAALKAEVRQLPCGHSLMMEAPDPLLAALRAFVTSTPRTVAA